MSGRKWSAEDDARFLELYPNLPTAEVAKQLGRSVRSVYTRSDTLDVRKSAEYLASPAAFRWRRDYHMGWEHRFKKGHATHNKGKKLGAAWVRGRMAETQFKKGSVSANHVPVGTIVKDVEGYLHKKIAEGNGGHGNPKVWGFVHRMVWEEANGPIPAGHVIRFKDENKENCALENLKLLSRRENMALNTVHRLPKELAELIQLKGALNRQIRKREKHGEEQDGRFTQSSL